MTLYLRQIWKDERLAYADTDYKRKLVSISITHLSFVYDNNLQENKHHKIVDTTKLRSMKILSLLKPLDIYYSQLHVIYKL